MSEIAKTAPPPKSGRLEVDTTREKLKELGLEVAAEELAGGLSEAVTHNRPVDQVLDRLLEKEVKLRQERRLKTSLKLSGLPPGMTLGCFDFGFQPSIDRKQIETLATCAFIREHTTLLVQGSPGVGKTHIVTGLAVAAIEHGFSVGFYRLEDLLHEMRKDEDVAPQRLRRRKYFNVAFLAVDEVGFEPMSPPDASLFFRLVSYRYMRGSTAITTNKQCGAGHSLFNAECTVTRS